MNKNIVFSTLALSIVAVSLMMMVPANQSAKADTTKCGGMKWGDTDHGDNNPSDKKFKQMAYHASICEVAKCVDHSECASGEKVNIDKFKKSPAYLNANDKQKDELDDYMKEGHGAEGLVGYEILDAVQESS